MASRTRIVCLCEGQKGDGSGKRTSIDPVFINRLMRSLKPSWLRPWPGSNVIRLVACGGRKEVIEKLPAELAVCLSAGGDTTLLAWADCDHDCADSNELKARFWEKAQANGITKEQFDRVVFILPKDRIENWIEYLTMGNTDESKEGPRVKHNREAAEAAKKLASMCSKGKPVKNMPPSLDWSCNNWTALVERIKKS